MSNLKPLVWARIDIEKLSGIYCEKTDSYIEDAVSFCSTPVAEYVIRKDKETGKYSANYGGRHENTYDTIDEAEHWAEHTHYPHKMQPYINEPKDTITDIKAWFQAAKPEPTDKDVCVQLGCHFEEIGEMLDELKEDEANPILHEIAGYMKSNDGAELVALDNKVDFLDSICDQIVTATGLAYMMGFDIEGAIKEVIRSNNSKFEGGKPLFNEQGKIMKGRDYSEPDLTPFISTMQNFHNTSEVTDD